jgi:hypothetical protein
MNFVYALAVALVAIMSVKAEETASSKRVRTVLAKNPDRWNFAKSCVGSQCGCFANGCWQQVQSCFGLDCYPWQCFGSACRCPTDQCLSACVGNGCVLEIVQVKEIIEEYEYDYSEVPSNWIWTDANKLHSRRRRHH